MKNRLFSSILLYFILLASSAYTNQLRPFSQIIKVPVGSYSTEAETRLPLITWGADVITIYANGNTTATANGSLFQNAGLKYQLFREDDFKKQVEMYISGQTVFLRGTMGMINMAAEVTSKSSKTKPVVIFQLSWSAGGDALVVKSGINRISDLKGKTIAIQQYGPHVDYLAKLLADAGVPISSVNLIWTKDLVGPEGDTPMARLYSGNVHAAFVIIPDAMALTSNGKVGTGAEDSVKGARILLSTKTANRIISDVYAVRSDYYQANKAKLTKFVSAMFKSEEKVKDLFKARNSSYKKTLQATADIILDDRTAVEDIRAMYYDAEMAGFDGNIAFFKNKDYPRNFNNLSKEIQSSFISLGLLSSSIPFTSSGINYASLSSGLKYANKAEAERFDSAKTTTVITKKDKQNTLDKSSLFSFKIYFNPNQKTFSVSQYKSQFDKVINYASTYGGAVITVEGNSDPMGYLRKKKEGSPQIVLTQVKQAAKNLSYSRADEVRKTLIKYAKSRGLTLDKSQFAIMGHGIEKPVYAIPKNKQQWEGNMRVEFKIIQIEAEEEVFKPL